MNTETTRDYAAEYRTKRDASYAALTNPAVKAYILDALAKSRDPQRFREAAVVDQSGWCNLAKADYRKSYTRQDGTTGTYGKEPYRPEPGASARLKLKEAVSFYYEQECYADYSRYAIPADVPADADREVLKRNLRAFGSALRTHTGMAGSGSTWEFELVELPEGAVVIATGRHSIAD